MADPSEVFEFLVFLSHAWGVDKKTHNLVARVFNALVRLGITAWFDENDMNGNIRDEMEEGIDNSKGFLAFVNEDYHDKVTGDNDLDNCRIEYHYARDHKGGSKMLAVVLDDAMKDPSKWKRPLKSLSKKLYVDMTRIDELLDEELDTLVKEQLVPKMTWLPEDLRKRVADDTGGSSSTSSPAKPPPTKAAAGVIINEKVDSFLKTSADFDNGLIEKLRDFGISCFGDLEEIAEESDLQGSGIPIFKARRLVKEVAKLKDEDEPEEPSPKKGVTHKSPGPAASAPSSIPASGDPPAACLRTLEGHADWVYAVSLSADGRTLATGSQDKTAKVWDASTGACLRTLEGHANIVQAVSLSADGRTLATGSDDKTAKVWDASTGACLRTLEGHADWVYAVSLSADGRTLATGSRDKTAKVWDASTGACLRTLEGHAKAVRAVSLSADGRTLATGSDDWTAKVWDASTGACLRTLEGHANIVRAVSLSADGRTLATCSWDNTARVWGRG